MTNIQGNRGRAAVTVAAMSIMLAAGIAAPAQTFTMLLEFNGTDGANPGNETLVQGADGNLYGTTEYGGPDYGQGGGTGGTLFKVTPSGILTTIYSFCLQRGCPDGENPVALVLGSDGSFYGTTHNGGANRSGTVFRITRAGALTTLYSFCLKLNNCTDGSHPPAGLVQGSDGNFYGTTNSGGTGNACSGGCGTVFKITPEGTLTTLHSFDVTTGDGLYPKAALIEGADGNFYGTTFQGGSSTSCQEGCGTVFKITPTGTITTLHSFDSTDGQYPYAALVQATDGNFYGTMGGGGANSDGTVFKITSAGTLTTLLSFDGADGNDPTGALVQATDGSFYGTTELGGTSSCSSGCGTLFKITSAGALTTLHSFDLTDGNNPTGGLVQATSGTFYGTTQNGGGSSGCSNNGCGTVFSLAVGLGPFVETVPSAGNVGKLVTILGTKLTGATSVTFNGTPASFTVESATGIKTTVPAGATTGPVKVVTPSSTLTSNVNFQVLP